MANSTKRKFCFDCGAELFDVARNTQRCTLCARWRRTEYQRWYHKHYQKRKRELGTTEFSPHRKEDFDDELADIRAEMARLGIPKNVKYVEKANIYI